jgi:serine/threonine protein kinase
VGIRYTLLIGRAPFESSDVKLTYRKIKCNNYSFPEVPAISERAQALIRDMLHPVPECRPTVEGLLHHEFFLPCIPSYLPLVATKSTPISAAAAASSCATRAQAASPTALNTPSSYWREPPIPVVASPSASVVRRPFADRTIDIANGADGSRPKRKSLTTTIEAASPSKARIMTSTRVSELNTFDTNALASPSSSAANDHNKGCSTPRKFTHPPSPPATPTRRVSATTPIKRGITVVKKPKPDTATEQLMDLCSTRQPLSNDASLATPAVLLPWTPQCPITKWQDFAAYGMGYEFSNGNIGVLFNDMTTILYVPSYKYVMPCSLPLPLPTNAMTFIVVVDRKVCYGILTVGCYACHG